jgi:ABC-type dipeptide/oligopeptide/nickel transport system permease subunit
MHISLFMRQEPLGFAALAAIIIITAAVLVLPAALSLDPYASRLEERMQGRSQAHPLGTDQVGRDVLARLVYGGRLSIAVGLLSTVAALIVGVSLGLFSGAAGGPFDLVIVQLTDISFAVPSLLLAIAAAAIMPGGILTVVLALALSGWGSFSRIARSSAKQLMANDYVLASRSLGGGLGSILFRHILPNAMSVLIVTSTLKMGSFILGEAALSFLGLGINPRDPSWGGMVSESSRFIETHPWLSVLPGALIAALVIAFNMLGDSLRDFYDARKSV